MTYRRGFSGLAIGIVVAVLVIAALGVSIFVVRYRGNPSITQSGGLTATSSLPEASTTNAGVGFIPQPTSTATSTVSALFASSSIVGNAYNLDQIISANGVKLIQAQADYLDKNKFLLVPLAQSSYYNFDEMLNYFDRIGGSPDKHYRDPSNAVFVTPDIVLEAYHKYFDLTLSELERTDLSKSLGSFLTEMFDNANQAQQSAVPNVAARYQNIIAQLTVAQVLLENQSPPKPDHFQYGEQDAYLANDKTIDSFDNAKKILAKYSSGLSPDLASKALSELQLIYAASNVAASPLWGQYKDNNQQDYTQFTPRSHYTVSSALRAYFRTMMYLGRNSYYLGKDVGIEDANLISALYGVKSSDGNMPVAAWQHITNITNFYVGVNDDLGYSDWQTFLIGTLGANNLSAQNLASAGTIGTIKSKITQLRLPRVLSDVVVDPNIASLTKADLLLQSLGFRIFGQKFTFDAWILNDLTAGQEATPVKLPSTPSALFIPAALGDMAAKNYSGQFLKSSAGFSDADVAGFMTKLAAKSSDLQKIKPDEWMAALGSGWLDVLSSLTRQYGSNYPLYMQSPAFSDKQIQTFLGSYTELKHDTLLYAKQSYAEKGGGGDDNLPPVPPVVKGFVEPNMDFWSKLLTLIDTNKQMFNANNVFQNHTALPRLQDFRNIVSFYQGIAQRELNGQPITEDEYEQLRNTNLSFMADPFGGETDIDPNTGKVALVADIHTDTVDSQILYEGTGKPYLMLAFVNNENSPRLVVGLAFNHYEFTGPLGGQRMTDEDWKKKVYDNPSSLPPKNFWYQSLMIK
jgi:hypothetical protein